VGWHTQLTDYRRRIEAGAAFQTHGSRFVPADKATALLESIIQPGDRVCLEGDNQKQADFLARALLATSLDRVNRLHLVQSSIVLPEHIALIERGYVDRLDFAFSGPQARPLYELCASRKVKIGAIHTYLELFGRYFVDLSPNVSLIAAEACDGDGNLFTGFNTEDTPVICEATRSTCGIVVAQVCSRLASIPRVDIPADSVDFIIETGEPLHTEPLFTRDPARITERQVLMAMMILKGIYAEYGVRSLNHGLGYATAAIELLLPTYGASLGMKGKCCTHWILNPHPTLIPAIESGFVQRVYSFGGEPGMEDYVRARPDVFAVGPSGEMRSNRCMAHAAGLYAMDLFAGATLQIDRDGNSSTAIRGMIAGFGGAPNLGGTPPGRRHITPAYARAGGGVAPCGGRKLVVQVSPTFSEKKGLPVFVNELDAVQLCRDGIFDQPPVMIAADQVTHIVTERGVAYLDRCADPTLRRMAIAAVAGETDVGRSLDAAGLCEVKRRELVRGPTELGIDPATATRSQLAASDLQDLVDISGGLYHIPASLTAR